MKTRNGFVSNSSSSSFVLIVKKEDYDDAIELIDDDNGNVKKMADATVEFKSIFGTEVAVYSEFSGMEGGSIEWLEVDIDDGEERYDAVEKLREALNKIDDKFTHSQDW